MYGKAPALSVLVGRRWMYAISVLGIVSGSRVKNREEK